MADTEPAVRTATASDEDSIRAVVTDAFGQPDEARLVDALRLRGRIIELVAENAENIVGHILLSPLVRPDGAYALAPLAVAPEHQRRGIGTALVRTAIADASAAGIAAIFVLGDPEFYTRAGFSRETAAGFDSPYPADYMTAMELAPGALDGAGRRLVYPEVFEQV